jgi:hypothetical protein
VFHFFLKKKNGDSVGGLGFVGSLIEKSGFKVDSVRRDTELAYAVENHLLRTIPSLQRLNNM